MLERIGKVENIPQFIEGVKNRKEKMFGFGHRCLNLAWAAVAASLGILNFCMHEHIVHVHDAVNLPFASICDSDAVLSFNQFMTKHSQAAHFVVSLSGNSFAAQGVAKTMYVLEAKTPCDYTPEKLSICTAVNPNAAEEHSTQS